MNKWLYIGCFIGGSALTYLIMNQATRVTKKKLETKITELSYTITSLKEKKKETMTQVVEKFSKETGLLETRVTKELTSEQIKEVVLDDGKEKTKEKEAVETETSRDLSNILYLGGGVSPASTYYLAGYQRRLGVFTLGFQVTCCAFKSVAITAGVAF